MQQMLATLMRAVHSYPSALACRTNGIYPHRGNPGSYWWGGTGNQRAVQKVGQLYLWNSNEWGYGYRFNSSEKAMISIEKYFRKSPIIERLLSRAYTLPMIMCLQKWITTWGEGTPGWMNIILLWWKFRRSFLHWWVPSVIKNTFVRSLCGIGWNLNQRWSKSWTNLTKNGCIPHFRDGMETSWPMSLPRILNCRFWK